MYPDQRSHELVDEDAVVALVGGTTFGENTKSM